MTSPKAAALELMKATNTQHINATLESISSCGIIPSDWKEEHWVEVVRKRNSMALKLPNYTVMAQTLINFYAYYSGTDFDLIYLLDVLAVIMGVTVIGRESPMANEDGRSIRDDVVETEFIENYSVFDVASVGSIQKDPGSEVSINLAENFNRLMDRVKVLQELKGLAMGYETEFEEVPDGIVEGIQIEVNIASLIVLNLLRFQKKEVSATLAHMVNRLGPNLRSLLKWKGPNPPMPANKFIGSVLNFVSADSDEYKHLIAIPIVCLVDLQKSKRNQDLQGFLKAGCLLALSENGLGALNWVFKMWTTLGANNNDMRKEVLEMFLNRLTGTSASEIWAFINKPKGTGWPFCRIFETTALAGLAMKNHIPLSLVCIHICLGNESMARIQEMPQLQQSRTPRTARPVSTSGR